MQPLYDLDDAAVRARLTAFRGVADMTASLLMLFWMGRAALPVDRHIARVCARLEWVPPTWTPGKVAQWLDRVAEPEWGARHQFHVSFIRHGRAVCTLKAPACAECPVRSLCPSAGLWDSASPLTVTRNLETEA
ncbi:endonuclease III domain-containing protein [Deinococcus lacus]|uniref:Endonuclease III domain-containing protein n=1 Tax=Deinococcus lacus TaxID=392561 RepID=A0ABW1Y9B4_9DEIO